MNKADTTLAPRSPAGHGTAPCDSGSNRPARTLVWMLLIVTAVFAPSLYRLFRFALTSDLYSHILLIPAVSAYMIWLARGSLPSAQGNARRTGALLLTLAFGTLAASVALESGIDARTEVNRLALTTSAWLVACTGACAWSLSLPLLRALAFPLGFLVFTIPIPTPALTAVETFMQHGSAAVAHVLFEAAGNAVFYEQLTFQLPGIALHVAPECSGIRSTLALFIVSIVTGYFFLRSPAHRALLAVAIVPLALVRNGFRIFTIGELCVRVGPEMIDSFIHRRGGPVFFALSLVPLFLLLVLLQRRERLAPRPTP